MKVKTNKPATKFKDFDGNMVTLNDADIVELKDLKIEMRVALKAVDKLWLENGHEAVITSTGGSVHGAGSLHPYGYAFDVRTSYFSAESHSAIAQELRGRLPDGYQVILHKTHIHVEYDAILR